MAYYTTSMLTTLTTTTQYATLATFKSGPNQRPVIKQIEIFTRYDNTTAGGIGLAINAAASATGIVNGGTPKPHEPGEPAAGCSTITSATTMATNGGASAVFKRFYHPGSGGAGVIWGLPELQGLLLGLNTTAAGSELCFVNLVAATPALYGINVTFTE